MVFENQVALVTGAARGIGLAIARALGQNGVKVAINDIIPSEEMEKTLEELRTENIEVSGYVASVTDREGIRRTVEDIVEKWGQIDILVNNAGIMPVSPLDDLRVEDWEEMIDVNIKGVLYGIAAALPVFRKQGFGHFVNIASTAGHKTVPNQSVYSGTKFAVRAISEGLRQEAGDKLRVTIISPGFVRTNFADGVTNPEIRAQLAASRDKFAMPPDAIARAIAFAIEQPPEIDVNEIVIRPTAQG
jgi:NADP-dependent 3-hydroxy acid dehydrogenase YdfG